MVADPALLGPAMIDLTSAARGLVVACEEISYSVSIPKPTNEQFVHIQTHVNEVVAAAATATANTSPQP